MGGTLTGLLLFLAVVVPRSKPSLS